MSPQPPTHGFIGAGAAGSALATALHTAGYPIAAIHNRSMAKADRLAASVGAQAVEAPAEVLGLCTTIWLTVPDDRIAALCRELPWTSDHRTIHCSGVASIDLLSSARAHGAATAVFHPLQSFAVPEHAAERLAGSFVGIEASGERFFAELETLASNLGAIPGPLPEDRTAYHASAVLASNALVALLGLASGLWAEMGSSRDEGLAALLPLVRGTIDNLSEVGLPDALTGPIARGDLGTIERHLDRLRDASPELRDVYADLGRAAISLALAKGGIDTPTAERIRVLLDKG